MRPSKAHPDAGAEGFSATACNCRHTRRSTEIICTRSGPTERHPKAAQNPLSGGQEGCLTKVPGLITRPAPYLPRRDGRGGRRGPGSGLAGPSPSCSAWNGRCRAPLPPHLPAVRKPRPARCATAIPVLTARTLPRSETTCSQIAELRSLWNPHMLKCPEQGRSPATTGRDPLPDNSSLVCVERHHGRGRWRTTGCGFGIQ